MELVDVAVKWPFKWCLVGSSGSGKTNFCLQIIKNAQRILDEPPSKILIIYKEFQPIYLEFNNYIPTKIEKLNKDMQFNLYSPEYLGLHN